MVQFAYYGMSRFEKFKNQIPLNLLLIKGHITKAKVSSVAQVENISNCLCRENNITKRDKDWISYLSLNPDGYINPCTSSTDHYLSENQKKINSISEVCALNSSVGHSKILGKLLLQVTKLVRFRANTWQKHRPALNSNHSSATEKNLHHRSMWVCWFCTGVWDR